MTKRQQSTEEKQHFKIIQLSDNDSIMLILSHHRLVVGGPWLTASLKGEKSLSDNAHFLSSISEHYTPSIDALLLGILDFSTCHIQGRANIGLQL